jgi:hypothetical protein
MFAVIAAIIFAIELIIDWANVKTSDAFTPQTLLFAGLLCLALHFAGVGTGWRPRVGPRSRAWRR